MNQAQQQRLNVFGVKVAKRVCGVLARRENIPAQAEPAGKDRRFHFVTELPGIGRTAVAVKCQSAMPDPKLGGVTGLDERVIERLKADQVHPGWRKTVMFVDYVLGAVYWTTLMQLMTESHFEDLNGARLTLPVRHMKFGRTPQRLWSVLWFEHVLMNWEPMTDLEVRALRGLRAPASKTGAARMGQEDMERAAYRGFSMAWAMRRSQPQLF